MIEFAPFRLDTANQCLWRHDEGGAEERILLKPKAYAILRYLVDHAGRLVSQEELLEAVWQNVHVEPDVLKRHIFDIRGELGDDPKRPRFIETLPRRGYQFIAPLQSASSGDVPIDTVAYERLVGRGRALGELSACLQRAARGERQIVFITGEPGIGKTALVDEFQREASRVPLIRVARGQCVEGYGGTEAYYPILEALGGLCRGPERESLVEILAAQAPTCLVQFPSLLKREHRETLQREIMGATRQRLLREIGDALETIASDRPLLLVLEDLHWADHSSIDFVSVLARGRGAARLMVVGTYRPVDAAVSGHPLPVLKQDLLVHRLCRELALEPLAEGEIAEYLKGSQPGVGAPEGFPELLHRHSDGNPLFMVEALRDLEERGYVCREAGRWLLRRPLDEIEVGVPEGLRQMIETQIDRLNSEEKQVLEAASPVSIGRSRFAVAPRAIAAEMTPEAYETVCESLARRHCILRPVPSETFQDGSVSACYEFVHALYREVCLRRLPARRRAKLHRSIGEWAETRWEVNEAAPWLASHFEEGGDIPRAVKYLVLAADNAMRRFEPREATKILQHSLDLAKKLPEVEGHEQEIVILEKLVAIHIASFDPQAIPLCEALVSRAARSGRIDVEVSTLLKLARHRLYTDFDDSLNSARRALDLTTDLKDPLLRARAIMTMSFIRLNSEGWDAGLAEDCRLAFNVIRQSAQGTLLGTSLLDYGYLQFFSSEYRAGYQNAMDGLAACVHESEESFFLSEAYQTQIFAPWNLLFAGEWGQALRQIANMTATMSRNGDYVFEQAYRLHGDAWVHSYALDYSGVLEICEPVLAVLEKAEGYRVDCRFCCTLVASAELNLGNRERAYQLLTATREDMERMTVAADWYYRMPHESVFTEFWLAEGNLTRARLEAEEFLKSALATAERTWQALAWEVSARVAMAEGDSKRARDDIANALKAVGDHEVPLASWRVHATAWELHERADNRDLAEQHRELSRQTIMKLADSLLLDAPLRQIFLSAPLVRKILADPLGRTRTAD